MEYFIEEVSLDLNHRKTFEFDHIIANIINSGGLSRVKTSDDSSNFVHLYLFIDVIDDLSRYAFPFRMVIVVLLVQSLLFRLKPITASAL